MHATITTFDNTAGGWERSLYAFLAPSRAFAAAAATVALLLAAACAGAKTSYDVSVAFNDRYTDAGGQAVEDAVHAYDAGADVLLQESFPPVARTTVHTNARDFCAAFRQRLQPRDDIASITCRT